MYKKSRDAQFRLKRETRTTHGMTRSSWTLIPGTKTWAIVLLLSGTPAWAAAGGLPQEVLSAIADDGDYDLRDADNRPISAPTVKEELRQASVEYQFRALFSGDLPRVQVIQQLMARFHSFLVGLAAPILPIFGFFDGLAPPSRPMTRPLVAGVLSSLAPALFGCLALSWALSSQKSRLIPQVLRC